MPIRVHCILFVALAVTGFACGCDNTSTSAVTPAPARFPWGKNLTMTSQTRNGASGVTDEQLVIQDPDTARIKQQFESLDWVTPKSRPTVRLIRNNERKYYFFLIGRPTHTLVNHSIAIWQGEDETGPFILKSEPLNTPKDALDLLLAFENRDPRLRDAVSWSDATTASKDEEPIEIAN